MAHYPHFKQLQNEYMVIFFHFKQWLTDKADTWVVLAAGSGAKKLEMSILNATEIHRKINKCKNKNKNKNKLNNLICINHAK